MVVYPFLLMVRLLAIRQFSPIVYYLPVTLGLTLMVPTRGRARPMERGVVCQPRVLVCHTCFSSFHHGCQDLLSSSRFSSGNKYELLPSSYLIHRRVTSSSCAAQMKGAFTINSIRWPCFTNKINNKLLLPNFRAVLY